jgi:hypothetical protein
MTTIKAWILTFTPILQQHNDDIVTCPFVAIQEQQRRKKIHERRNGNWDFRPTVVGSHCMHKTRERENYKGIQQQQQQQQRDNKGNGEV